MNDELIKRLRIKANRQWRQLHDDTADLLREAADALSAVPSAPAVAVPDVLRAFADEVKQLCKDFSDRQNRPYMGDVTAAIDGLYEQFAAAPASPAATGWMPIETAPKDVEVLIGAFIDGEWQWGRSVRFYESANEFEGETFSGWVWSIDDVSESVAEFPTHWQPLPPAPSVDGEG